MQKVYWVNRYFERTNKLFDQVHEKWLDEAIRCYGSTKHQELTFLKNKIYYRLQVLVRYSRLLTTSALQQLD